MPRGAKDEAGAPARAVAELIRRELGAQRISGRKLAELTGKSERYMRERISGQRALDLNDLDDIAQALGLDVIVLLEQAEKSTSQRSIVRMSDYRTDTQTTDVSGTQEDATVTQFPARDDLTAEEAEELLRTHRYAADTRDGRDDEQEADPLP